MNTDTQTHTEDAHYATQTQWEALAKLVALTRKMGSEVGEEVEVGEEKWGSVGNEGSLLKSSSPRSPWSF